MKREQVPLAVDAEIRIDFGMGKMPLRGVALVCVALFPALGLLQLSFLQGGIKALAFFAIMAAAYGVAEIGREGIWIGTYGIYRLLAPVLPWAIVESPAHPGGEPVPAAVTCVPGLGMEVSSRAMPRFLRPLAGRLPLSPRAVSVQTGMFELNPGGWRGVLAIEPPPVARHTDDYGYWVEQVVAWLSAIGEAAQFYAVSEPFDRVRAVEAYDQTFKGLKNPLNDDERDLVAETAGESLSISHYIVLSPASTGRDGIPLQLKPAGLRGVPATPKEQVERALERALSFASNHGIRTALCDRDQIGRLLRRTPLLAPAAAFAGECAQIGTDFVSVVCAKSLPADVEAGMVVRALLEDRARGTVSLFIGPIDPSVARDKVTQVRKVFQRLAHKNDDLDAGAMAASATDLALSLVTREKTAHTAALTFDIRADSPEELAVAREKLIGKLDAEGLRPTLCANPGMVPALAAAPGCAPLSRSLLRPLTTNGVVACLLPAMSTPFGRPEEPYLGQNAQTGMPAYLNVFRGRDNMNLTCIGQMGKGKSVTMKTMLYRHSCRGIRIAVLDPHDEYKGLMSATGGVYLELGEQAVNALWVEDTFSPDEAASLALPALSVMAGDEHKPNSQGYPIRRLKDEDKGWLHRHLAAFYGEWRQEHPRQEPLISDLVAYLEMRAGVLKKGTETEVDRARRIIERLSSFTQGSRGRIFNQPMNLNIGDRSVAFGLGQLGQQYGADMTPALAIILGYLLREMMRTTTGMIVMIDEAHYILDDPDAGNVLNRMVRGVRKRGVGVWMASQQVEDFLSENGLGKTLAANSETKMILGIDRTVADAAEAALGLTAFERKTVSQDCPRGRAVVISGSERAVVDIVPGAHLMWMVSTTSSAQAA